MMNKKGAGNPAMIAVGIIVIILGLSFVPVIGIVGGALGLESALMVLAIQAGWAFLVVLIGISFFNTSSSSFGVG